MNQRIDTIRRGIALNLQHADPLIGTFEHAYTLSAGVRVADVDFNPDTLVVNCVSNVELVAKHLRYGFELGEGVANARHLPEIARLKAEVKRLEKNAKARARRAK